MTYEEALERARDAAMAVASAHGHELKGRDDVWVARQMLAPGDEPDPQSRAGEDPRVLAAVRYSELTELAGWLLGFAAYERRKMEAPK